jgi:hypothetical protein
METPQNKRLYGKIECLPLWPTYLGEKGRTLGKTYGIKVRHYWEHPLGNTLGTYWESDGDPMSVLLLGRNFTKSRPENLTYNKGFFMEEIIQVARFLW